MPLSSREIADRLRSVSARIAEAERRHDRPPHAVRLLAVTKRRSVAEIRAAFNAGQRLFGENTTREALPKLAALAGAPIEWHFIGSIQRNKTRAIAEHFAWVHSLDRPLIAERLHTQRGATLPALNVCIQVNLSGEAQKSGMTTAPALKDLARVVVGLPHLALRGLMTFPAHTESVEEQHRVFRRLRLMRDRLQDELGIALDTLSMGTSHDFEAAIAEGSSLVRIGTALFEP